jgi:hypothetical protein
VRRRSAINEEKWIERVKSARRMTPEQRLSACVHLSRVIAELHQAGRKHRDSMGPTPIIESLEPHP